MLKISKKLKLKLKLQNILKSSLINMYYPNNTTKLEKVA